MTSAIFEVADIPRNVSCANRSRYGFGIYYFPESRQFCRIVHCPEVSRVVGDPVALWNWSHRAIPFASRFGTHTFGRKKFWAVIGRGANPLITPEGDRVAMVPSAFALMFDLKIWLKRNPVSSPGFDYRPKRRTKYLNWDFCREYILSDWFWY